METTKDEERFYTFTRMQLGDYAKKNHANLSQVYGVHACSYGRVTGWMHKFRGRQSFEDLPHAGGPKEIVNKRTIAAVHELIKENPHITVQGYFPVFWLLLNIIKFSSTNLYSVPSASHNGQDTNERITDASSPNINSGIIFSSNNTLTSKSDGKHQNGNRNYRTKEMLFPLALKQRILSSESSPSSEETTHTPDSKSPQNLKDAATFFFTNVGPHSFEYRAMFQHNKNSFSKQNIPPALDDFPNFPKIPFPPFPSFPDFHEIFHNSRKKVELPPFHFPTVHPAIKRISEPSADITTQTPAIFPYQNNFNGPFQKYDVVLGNINTKYPKIFRFNEERINIADFDKMKKRKIGFDNLNPNDILDPQKIQRNQFLILHGGIFTVQEPPLYNQNDVKIKRPLPTHDIYRIFRNGKTKKRHISPLR